MESICTNNGVLFDQMPFDDSPISQQPHSSSVVPFLCQSLPHLLVLIIIMKKRRKKKKKREKRNGSMGQVLSNILDYILCGEEVEDEPKRPSDTLQLLISPANPHVLQAKPSTNVSESLLLQTQLSSSPTSDSCSDSGKSYVSNPPQIYWSNKSNNTEQNRPQNQSRDILISSSSESYVSNPPRLNWSNNSRNTEHNGIWNQPQDILIYSSNLELSLGDNSSSGDGALQRDLLISLPWLKYSSFTDQKKQIIFPLLSEVVLNEEIEEEDVSKAVVIEEKWMKHYSSCQKILLVGEGDFSFSASLAVAFGSASNIIATSLNSEGFLSRNYSNAMSNIQSLRSRGAKVMHGVDATEMANLFLFEGKTFDRIIFNFPHAGFIDDESKESKLRRHRKLVRLFMANAKRMITEDGEIHVTHKSNPFFRKWNLWQLGSSEGLRLIEEVHFNFRDYPGYGTKYGDGGDKNFDCDPSKTYKFELQIRGFSPYA